jgi:hypothetical protein
MLQIFTLYPEENVQAILQPRQPFLMILAGWVNRSQQDAIDFLLTENRVLRQKPGKKRILLNEDQRCRLAVNCPCLVALISVRLWATISTNILHPNQKALLSLR